MSTTERGTGDVRRRDAAGLQVMERLDELARFTSEPEALTRLYLTPEHKAAAQRVARWMRQAGMTATLDAVGSVVGRYEAATPGARTLILGSHIDTVRNAGRYDGNFGVVAAIEAVASLAARQARLPFAIEVVAFGDEEGVRFPVTLTGSRALAGSVDPKALDSLDESETSLRQALIHFGGDPDAIKSLARKPASLLGYVELHIEQGPVLEALDLPVGVVTAINGASRLRVEVIGTAGHAGTVPMGLRRDALAAAAEMALAVEEVALATPALVATVGRFEARPGAVNVVPGQVIFTVDTRSSDDAVRHAAVATLRQRFAAIAERRGLRCTTAATYDEAAVPCAPWLIERLDDAVARTGIAPHRLPSGAGHDGLAIAPLCPVGMLFVRCAGGISHNPAESITTADAGTAVAVLLSFLEGLDPAAVPLNR